MADIDVQRKSGASWLWWVIGLIILALIIWWLVAYLGRDSEVAPVATTAPVVTEPMSPATPVPAPTPEAGIPVADILANPASWDGRTVSGTVTVADVPTDRGFWIESNGQRLFALINDQPNEQPQNINPGQVLQITSATVMTSASEVPGTLDTDTQGLLQGQPVFLDVDESNIELAQPATAQATGTAGA
ncbi:MAG TPA: hypothetical protein VFI96_06005 [Longimicrobiaceae bacterium]|nr:hypothetical protein [Longimicrobiaceae bacterium]